MKKNLIALLLISACSVQAASNGTVALSWEQARTAIIERAKHIKATCSSSVYLCAVQIAELVLAKKYDEGFEAVEKIVKEILPQLPIYKEFLKNPNNKVCREELKSQASMVAGQLAAQIHDKPEFVAKILAIIGLYIDVLEESILKQ